jgi:hypothetical protein
MKMPASVQAESCRQRLAVSAHIRGICRACDPCTATLLASARTQHDAVREEDGQPPHPRPITGTAEEAV